MLPRYLLHHILVWHPAAGWAVVVCAVMCGGVYPARSHCHINSLPPDLVLLDPAIHRVPRGNYWKALGLQSQYWVTSLRLGDTYVSGNSIIIGSGNDLLLVQRQAITWTNDDFLTIVTLGITFTEFSIKNTIFYQENVFQNLCKMAAIFQCFKKNIG